MFIRIPEGKTIESMFDLDCVGCDFTFNPFSTKDIHEYGDGVMHMGHMAEFRDSQTNTTMLLAQCPNCGLLQR